MSQVSKRHRGGARSTFIAEFLESRQLLTTYSIHETAVPSSLFVTNNYGDDHQTATIQFNITTTFSASKNDKDDHITDVNFSLDLDGGSVVSGTTQAPGLTDGGGGTSFSASGNLTPTTYSLTEQVSWQSTGLGVRHVKLDGTLSAVSVPQKTDSVIQNITIPAGTIDLANTSKADKYGSGGLVAVNADDDDKNKLLDYSDTVAGSDENDLVELTLHASGVGGRYQLQFTDSGAGQNIKIWAKADKSAADASTNLVGGTGSLPTHRIGSNQEIFNAGVDTKVYVEGISQGSASISLRWKSDTTSAPYGVADVFTVNVVAPLLSADTIAHHASTGTLDAAKKLSDGAWVSVNSDDDDYDGTPDQNEGAGIAGENDLLPIHLASIGSGTYTIQEIPSIVKLFRSAIKGSQFNVGETLSGSAAADLYIEGEGTGSGTIKISWSNGSAFNSDAGTKLKISVFGLTGAQNVPGNASYIYQAAGTDPVDSVPGWSSVTDGAFEGSSGGLGARVKWNNSAAIGAVGFKASADYLWDYDVNVVEIDVGQPTSTYVPTLTQDSYDPTLIDSAVSFPAMVLSVPVTISGPTAPGPNSGVMRGVSKIDVGILQNVTITKQRAFYTGGERRRSVIEGNTYVDGPSGGASPYYDPTDAIGGTALGSSYTSGTTPISLTLTINDRPGQHGTDDMDIGIAFSDYVQSWQGIDDFTDWVSARTHDDVNGSGAIYTAYAETKWRFDFSGNVSNGVWSPLASAGVYETSPWSTGGFDQILSTGGVANDSPDDWVYFQ